MNELVGKWIQKEGQPYAGLCFEFKEDGSFAAEYDAMSITSGGTYIAENGIITMQQTTHTFGLVGEFKGRYAVTGDELHLALAGGAGQTRPEDLSEARQYVKSSKDNED